MSLVLDNPLVVLYNNNDLNSISNFTVLNRDVNTMPTKSLRVHKLARTDGSILTTSEFDKKIINIQGSIVSTNREDAETAIDSLRALLASPEGNIDIQVAGATRRFVGTMSAMTTALKGGYGTVNIEFTCSYPFGQNTDILTLQNAVANTASTATWTLAIEGSYKAEPYISVTYSAVTGGTGATVSLYNNADGIGLDVTWNVTAGDILEVDNLNKTVQVNGIDVTRTGRYFNFLPGSRTLGYNDTLTTRTMALTVTYQKRYV